MKKCLIFLLVVFLLPGGSLPCLAEDRMEYSTNMLCFDDGSYIIISDIRSEDQVDARASTKSKSGSRDISSYDSNNNLMWKFTLTAYFTYTEGISVQCTDATYTYLIEDDSWSFSNGSAVASGNVGMASGTFIKKLWNITTKTHPVELTITCDEYGNLS